MTHPSALIGTIAVAFGVALLLGIAAARVGLPPIVGYLAGGIVVGPFTPWFAVDAGLASQAADVGVVLLMFGVGLRFSVGDLVEVRGVVVPGALAQIVITGSVGTALGRAWGLPWGGALVLGIALAVASTVVALKGLEARDRLDSLEGHLAVGWLVVEDLAMVIALVLLPALAPLLGGTTGASAGTTTSLALSLGAAALKVAVFAALMVFVGRRAVPPLLSFVARLGSRELFTLTVLATALGVGTLAAEVFGVSLALGAFFAGAVVSESELSHRAAAEALPLQDAFAVLFFVSVGMLFDPRVLLERPMPVLAVLGVIVIGKPVASFTLLRALGQPMRTSLTLAASLAQIGEFSFIIAALGVSLGLLSPAVQTLIIAGALLSITLNEPAFAVLERYLARRALLGPASPLAPGMATGQFDFTTLRGHVVVVGYGRVGTTVADALDREEIPFVVVEEQERIVAALRRRDGRAIAGDASRADVLERAGVPGAALIVVTAPEPIRARRIVEVARSLNPTIPVAVRTHTAAEQAWLETYLRASPAPGLSVYAEREAAFTLAHFALRSLGRTEGTADLVVGAMRQHPMRPSNALISVSR